MKKEISTCTWKGSLRHAFIHHRFQVRIHRTPTSFPGVFPWERGWWDRRRVSTVRSFRVIWNWMVHQRNRWIHSGHGFIGSLDAPWSEWLYCLYSFVITFRVCKILYFVYRRSTSALRLPIPFQPTHQIKFTYLLYLVTRIIDPDPDHPKRTHPTLDIKYFFMLKYGQCLVQKYFNVKFIFS